MPVTHRARRGAIIVKALICGKMQVVQLREGATLSNLLIEMSLPLTSCIAVRDDVPIPSDEPLHDGDRIALLETFSGG
ncbi:MAG: MoaD/ThiS family protein [Euryarchaeota archaeon]|nr:MoaD/ThiS family protein [Euryarchaeota archaeon]